MDISPIILQIGWGVIFAGIAAGVAVLGGIAGSLSWLNRRRWRDVNSAREQEEYLRDHFQGTIYGDGPLTGTVTNIKVEENSGILYRVKKPVFAEISGTTKVTMRFNGMVIDEDRLNQDPFPYLFENPDQVDLVDAEHLRTQPNMSQGLTLVQIRVHSMGYDEVGSWCAALPQFVWGAYQREQAM